MGRTTFIAADALTDVDKGRVPLSDAQWGPALNAGFSISGTINPQVVPQSLVKPYETIIYVYRDGKCMGGGVVDNVQPQSGTGAMAVTCIGFESYPNVIYPEASLGPYVYTDPIDIARDLWTYLQSLPDADLGIVLGGATTGGKVKVGTPDDLFRVDWWDTQSIGDYLTALMSADDGFDCHIEITTDSSGTRTKELHFDYPRLGSRNKLVRFDDKVNVVALPNNMTIFGAITDVVATGSGTGRTMLRSTASRRGSGQLRKMMIDSLPNEKNQARLDARARSDLAAQKVVVDIGQLQLREHPMAMLGAIKVGDDVYTSLTANWNDFKGWMRVIGWQFVEGSQDNASNAQDQLLIDVARSDQFSYGPDPNITVSTGGGE